MSRPKPHTAVLQRFLEINWTRPRPKRRINAVMMDNRADRVISLPFLRLPLYVTSTQTRIRRWRRRCPCHPWGRRKRRQHSPDPAHWQSSSISMYRPTNKRFVSCTLRNFFSIVTRQFPPPRFSFHHLVFRTCNFPSSCSFNTAPLINVLYGDPWRIAIP